MLPFLGRRIVSKRANTFFLEIRTFLSKSYNCQEVWEQRKRAPIFKKIDYDDLYHQLDRNFQIGQRISVLDVDLFVNGINSESYQNELEDILFKLRLNPETGLLSERTMHAVVRFYASTGKTKDVLNILSNRLNYGIFPDYYTSNMLIDIFLKDGDSISAAKVAALQMLQEDFEHPILRPLSIYSCYKYLNSSDVWRLPKEDEVDPDEDEVKVRVSYIRNSYFDDHFDLVDTNHLIGKTLYMAGKSHQGPLGLSSQLIGMALYEKWAALKGILIEIGENNATVHGDAINKTLEFTLLKPKQLEGETMTNESDEVKAMKTEVVTALEKIKNSGKTLPGDVEAIAAAEVAKAVSDHELEDIQQLTKIYRKWEKEREDHIQQEIFESKKRKIVEEISKTKEALKQEEEMIFFFDKEEDWELKVQQKEEEIKALAEIQNSVKKKPSDENYIPPEVGQKRN